MKPILLRILYTMMKYIITLAFSITLYSCSTEDNQRDQEFIALSSDALGNMSFELEIRNNELIDQLKIQYPVLDSVREVRTRIIGILHSRLNYLVDSSGGLNEIGDLINPNAEKLVYTYLIQEQEANKMRAEILEEIENSNISGLASWNALKDAKDIPVFANDDYQSEKAFAEVNFDNRKLYQVIHSFKEIRLNVLIEEQTFIARYLANKKRQD